VLAATPYLYRLGFGRVEAELRSRVAAKIGERFPKLEVQVRAAHLTAEGISVQGLSITEPDAPGPEPEIVHVDEVFLACRTNVQELLSGEPVVTSVRFSRPILRATRRPDGTFSLAKMFPLPKYNRTPPAITIENGTIVVFDPLKNPSSTFTLRDVNLTVKRSPAAEADQNLLEVQGSLVSDQIQRVEVLGTIDPSGPRWSLGGTVENMEISPALRTALPERVAASLEPLKSLRAMTNWSFRASSDDAGKMPRFEVNGRVVHGRLEDPLLPYPVTDLQAEVHGDNSGFRIRNLTARHGPTIWEVAEFKQTGFEPRSPFVLRACGKQVRLDRRWAQTLPKPWSVYWTDYDPDGEVNLDCTLVFDGRRFQPTLQVTCLDNVSFSCHKFPYRLEGARGTMTLRDNVLDVALTAYSGTEFQQAERREGVREPNLAAQQRGGAPVTLRGSFSNPGPQYTGWIEIHGDRIQFDEKLFAALLKPKARETLRSLNPRGTFKIAARLGRDDPQIREMHQFAEITLDRCSLVYDKFPVPLNNVHGVLHLRDGQWTTHPEYMLKGRNGTGAVDISGTLSTSANEDVLALSIHAENFPLHEELRDALSPSQRQLWLALQPHGKFNLDAGVHFNSRAKKMTVELRAFPRDDASSIGTSIEPVAFPYRMRLRGGSIHYADNKATLENLRIVHGTTTMRTMGSCDLSPDGGWKVQLRDLAVDRVRLRGEDHDLESALPEALRHAIAELKPGGPINLHGAVDFAKFTADGPLQSSWDVDVEMHQGSLQVGPKLENIFGKVRLTGSANGTRYSSHGELALDSVNYKNFQLKGVIGPFWFDNNNVVLGHWGNPPQGQTPRHITAELLGGVLTGDCHVKLGALPHYHLIASVAQADLQQFAQSNLSGNQKLKGKILAQVNLQGSGGPKNLVGTGTIHLSDADVYELPVMVSLLKIARAKAPDSTAFTQSDVNFAIQGEHVTLNQINLDGDAISLSGHGELTLDGQSNPINLELHSRVGRGNVPLLSGLLSEASQHIMLIYVNGTLDHPTTRAEAFPAAQGALQQLQAETERSTLLPRPGAIMRNMGIGR